MPAKTSQLQIRVTAAQKATLRRLAAAANTTVSDYVLSQALPSGQRELDRAVSGLAGPPEDRAAALEALSAILAAAPADDLSGVLASPPLDALTPLLRNELAALVEQAVYAKGGSVPPWVHEVPPLRRPHFLWPLASLRPHQIRVTPVAFKRRGLFFDPASQPALSQLAGRPPQARPPVPESRRRLTELSAAFASLELKVEFYLLGGAVLWQPFRVRPTTAHIDAMFQPLGPALDAASQLARRHGWPSGWLEEAVEELLMGGSLSGGFLDLGHVAAFVASPEYVLALKVGALRLGPEDKVGDDLRYVLRALNVTTPEAALEIVGRYFSARQIPDRARETLEGLLGT